MKKILIMFLVLMCSLMLPSKADEATQFYVIHYDGNGKNFTNEITVQSKNPGESISISSLSSSYGQSIFGGWALSPDSTDIAYLPGDMYSDDADITLYAIWLQPEDIGTIADGSEYEIAYPVVDSYAAVTFTVGQDGYYRITSANYMPENHYTSSMSQSINIIDENGYFKAIAEANGITDRLSTDGRPHYNNFQVSAYMTAGTTYYLRYTQRRESLKFTVDTDFFAVEYNANGINQTIPSQTKTPGVPLKLSGDLLQRSEYIFGGWALDPSASVADYLPGDEYTIDANNTLYAIWLSPWDIGTLPQSGAITVTYPVIKSYCFFDFSVPETGYYRISSTNKYSNGASSSTYITTLNSYGNRIVVADGDWVTDENEVPQDFTFTTKLQAGQQYRIFYKNYQKELSLKIDNNLSVITYHRNGSTVSSPSRDLEAAKVAGEDYIITSMIPRWENTNNGIFRSFAGWGLTSDSVVADYISGDSYSVDAPLDLYAIWKKPNEGGNIKGNNMIRSEFPAICENGWLHFTVSRTGYYKFTSTGDYYTYNGVSYSGGVYVYGLKENLSYYSILARSTKVNNDFMITAYLETGKNYYLTYMNVQSVLHLFVEPQFIYHTSVDQTVGGESVTGIATMDFYINGELVAEGVEDYAGDLPVGATYEIKNIRVRDGYEFVGVSLGSLSGVVEDPGNEEGIIYIQLDFAELITEEIDGLIIQDGTLVSYIGDKPYVSIIEEYGITKIGNRAFYENDTIESLTISLDDDQTIEMGSYAFASCHNLKYVFISNVEYIDEGAFMDCDALEYMSIGGKIRYIAPCSIPSNVEIYGDIDSITEQYAAGNENPFSTPDFEFDNYICQIINSECIICAYTGSAESVEIPSFMRGYPVTGFGDKTCFGELKEIKLPDTITEITKNAFQDCYNLETVILPSGLKRIEGFAFAYCENLKYIELPDSVAYIGDNAFSDCHQLSDISLPNSLKYIGTGAFSFCNELKTMIIPSSVEYIGDALFDHCENMLYVVIEGTPEIENSFCWMYPGVIFCKKGTDTEKAISLWEEGYYKIIDINKKRPETLTYLYLPSSLTEIEAESFSGIDADIIIVPRNVTYIGDRAFENCRNLEFLAIANQDTKISDTALDGCSDVWIADAGYYIGSGILNKNVYEYVLRHNYSVLVNEGWKYIFQNHLSFEK